MTSINPKVTAGTLGAALSAILVWILGEYGIDIPPGVAIAFTTIATFACGWVKSA